MIVTRNYLLLFLLVLLGTSCRQNAKHGEYTNPGSDWRYLGETPPGSAPEIFSPGLISTDKKERDMAVSPSGNEIFYTLVLPNSNLSAILYIYNDGAFWSGKQVAPFSGTYSDLEPAFSPDGKKLFFASKRPVTREDTTDDWNIWYTENTGGQWSEPKMTGTPVCNEGDEYYPSCAESGNLYFTAHRDDSFGAEDIYFSKLVNGQYTQPVNLGRGVNSEKYEFNAFVARDESYLIFSSFGRDDGFGGGDLYISFRVNDSTWTEARNLGQGINSDKLDYCPFVTFDGKYLFFTSNRVDPEITGNNRKSYDELMKLAGEIENGAGNIYWVNFDPESYR